MVVQNIKNYFCNATKDKFQNINNSRRECYGNSFDCVLIQPKDKLKGILGTLNTSEEGLSVSGPRTEHFYIKLRVFFPRGQVWEYKTYDFLIKRT